MHTRSISGVGLLIITLLSGCAAYVPGSKSATNARAQLEMRAETCATLKEAKTEILPRVPTTINLNEQSQVFRFKDGKSYFVLYRLPEFMAEYQIDVLAAPAGHVQDQAIVLPHVEFYDEEFRSTRSFDETSLRNRGSGLERTVFVTRKNSAERYLLIRGANLVGNTVRTTSVVQTTPIPVGTAMIFWHSGQDFKTMIHSSPAGVLNLSVRGLEPAEN